MKAINRNEGGRENERQIKGRGGKGKMKVTPEVMRRREREGKSVRRRENEGALCRSTK